MFRRLRTLLRPRPNTQRAYRFHLRYWFHPDVDIAAGVLATLRPSRALTPELSGGPAVERLTIIAPHPDDEVMGPGGALLAALARGVRCHVIFLTDGENDADKAALRRAEAENAAATLGYSPAFLGFPADNVQVTPATTAALTAALKAARPQAVMVPFLLEDNDDHRAASMLLAHVGDDLPGTMDIWSYQVYSALPANVLVPLDQDMAAAKADAIRLYGSQFAVRDWANFALGLNAYNTRLAPRRCQEKHVEAFYVLPLGEYRTLCQNYYRAKRGKC